MADLEVKGKVKGFGNMDGHGRFVIVEQADGRMFNVGMDGRDESGFPVGSQVKVYLNE